MAGLEKLKHDDDNVGNCGFLAFFTLFTFLSFLSFLFFLSFLSVFLAFFCFSFFLSFYRKRVSVRGSAPAGAGTDGAAGRVLRLRAAAARL